MTRYVWDSQSFIFRDRKTGEPMQVADDNAICMPVVRSDIPEYRSPIDGKLITSRSHRREDLARNGCVEMDPPKRPRGFKNKRFTKRHSLPYL
jgi:hypothetical protein